tara:strand:+ start:1510 stop:2919 length:1410 start_codon:yes stop_codon:yes gene_type:complete
MRVNVVAQRPTTNNEHDIMFTRTQLKKTVKTSMPMIVVQFLGSINGFLGMLMLSHLGHDVLAASSILFATYVFIFMLFSSILFSTSVLIAQALGRGEQHTIGQMVQQSWFLSILLSIPIMLLYWFIQPILLMLGQEPKLVAIIIPYFHTVLWGIVPIMMTMVSSQFAYGVQKPKLVMKITGLGIFIMIFLGYAFIYGRFGFPRMGVAGWGIASAITNWVFLFAYLASFIMIKEFACFQLFSKHCHKGFHHLKKLWQVGWPITVQTTGELASFFFITIMVGWIGASALAAQQVVTQYLMLLLIPIFGLTQAAGVLVGHAVGSKQHEDINAYAYATLSIAIVYCVVAFVIFNLFPTALASLFIDVHAKGVETTLHLIRVLFVIVLIAQLFDSIRNVMTGALRGLLDTRIPMIISLTALWLIRIPLSYVMGFPLKGGLIGISLAAIIAMGIGGLLLWWRWHRKSALLIQKGV